LTTTTGKGMVTEITGSRSG